jgi:trans-L-3-hydroxyproline dehydratase
LGRTTLKRRWAQMKIEWNPPKDWIRIKAIDAHAEGEPLRILTEGFPLPLGKSILEKRKYLQDNFDQLRTALMWEPRGHADMYGCVVTEPDTPDGTIGVIFLHNEGYSTMCGHGILALTKVALETGMIELDAEKTLVKIDTPAGQVTARAHMVGNRIDKVSFKNVPSFVYALDQRISIPGLGDIRFDLAFGGAFYAFCQADELGLNLIPEEFSKLVSAGRSIKHAITEHFPIQHPFEEELSFLYGTIFTGPAHTKDHHSRNVCVFAEGEVDRCPTGTGVSARAALHFTRGEIGKEEFVVESILGTSFTGRVVETTTFGPYKAVIPEISGTAYITGKNELLIDPSDPLKNGFFLR